METSGGAFGRKTLFNQSAGREIGEARPGTRPLPAACNDSPAKLASITRLAANAMTLQHSNLPIHESGEKERARGTVELACQTDREGQRRGESLT